jgi:hypothetical protein
MARVAIVLVTAGNAPPLAVVVALMGAGEGEGEGEGTGAGARLVVEVVWT